MAIDESHRDLSVRLSEGYGRQAMKISIAGEEQADGLVDRRSSPPAATFRWQVSAYRVSDCASAQGPVRFLEGAADLLFVSHADSSGI